MAKVTITIEDQFGDVIGVGMASDPPVTQETVFEDLTTAQMMALKLVRHMSFEMGKMIGVVPASTPVQ